MSLILDNALLDSALKVSLVLGLGLAATVLLRHQSAAVRHWVLAATILCAMAVPLLERMLPAWRVPVASVLSTTPGSSPAPNVAVVTPPRLADAATFAPSGRERRPEPSIDRTTIAAAIWLAGASLVLGGLLAGLIRLAWLAARSPRIDEGPWVSIAREIEQEYGLTRRSQLLHGDHPSLLITWGVVSPKILVPSPALSWSADRIRIVLRHELAHVRRGDWIAQLAGEVLRSIYWFNPLLWVACSRLRAESEQACDDEVLSGGVQASEYATHLLEVARALKLGSAPRLPAPAIARSSRLERRFAAMLNARVIRNPTTKSFRFMTAAALLAATSLVAAAQSGSSTLSGSVVDSSGAPVPNGAVALINKNTAAKFEVRTDDRGQFQFVPLPADAYTLEVSMPGFKKASAEVTLSGKSVRHDITLQLGSLSETVNIVGGPGSSRGPDSGSKTQELDMARSGFQRDLKACVPSSAGGRIRPPRKIKDVRPVYPENLQAAGVAGTVVLSATIGTDGMVKDAEVLKSAHPDLDLAAIEAVRQWQFDGTLLNCVPSEVTMNVSLNFNVK